MALKLNEHISNHTKLYTLGGEPVTILNLISEEGGQGMFTRYPGGEKSLLSSGITGMRRMWWARISILPF